MILKVVSSNIEYNWNYSLIIAAVQLTCGVLQGKSGIIISVLAKGIPLRHHGFSDTNAAS